MKRREFIKMAALEHQYKRAKMKTVKMKRAQ